MANLFNIPVYNFSSYPKSSKSTIFILTPAYTSLIVDGLIQNMSTTDKQIHDLKHIVLGADTVLLQYIF